MAVFLMFLFTACLATVSGVQGQSPYELSKKDPALLSLGAGLSLAGHIQILRTDAPSYPDLDLERVPSFDRFSAGFWNERAQLFSHVSVGAAGVGAASLLAWKPVRQDLWTVAVMGAESFLLSDGIVSLAKPIVLRPRPFLYGNAAPIGESTKPDAFFSFFSAHTTYAATFSFFTAKVLHDLNPDARWRKWVWAGAALLPAASGALRVAGGKHFLSDVVVGYAIGALSGILVPELHKRKVDGHSQRLFMPSLYVQQQGLGLIWRF